MARVLCINSWIYDFAAYNTWIEPLGLLTVASVLRLAGHEVDLIDCLDRFHPDAPAPQSTRDRYGCGRYEKVELPKPDALAHVPRRWGRYGLPTDIFQAELDAQPRPDVVLVTSSMTYWYPGPFTAIDYVKRKWLNVPVGLGGVYATLCTAHARTHSGADVVFAGTELNPVLAWIEQISGQAHSLSMTEAEMLNIRPAHDLRRPQGFAAILTSRGCPYACPYCAVHLVGTHLMRRPVTDIVDEIAWCQEALGMQDIAFYDDALLYNREQHIYPLLDALIARQFDIRFHTPNGLHTRWIDRQLAQKMWKAGFRSIRLGLETADPVLQKQDGAKVNRQSFTQAAEALLSSGFAARDIAAYILIGRPDQHVESVLETATFAQELGIPVSTAQFSPIPGTAEWQKAVDLGQVVADADPLLHNNSIYPCGQRQAWEHTKQQIRERNRVHLFFGALDIN